MKPTHFMLLVIGIVLILSGVLAPWLASLGISAPGPPAEAVPPAISNTFLALLIGIPMAAAGCVLVASAIVAHVFRRR
jgi:uncharacterized membrane protein HdeD (DUF308 family)